MVFTMEAWNSQWETDGNHWKVPNWYLDLVDDDPLFYQVMLKFNALFSNQQTNLKYWLRKGEGSPEPAISQVRTVRLLRLDSVAAKRGLQKKMHPWKLTWQ